MEILLEAFLIFTGLMFWIMFISKSGVLAELKKTEKKISEKILVLEDLLDQTKPSELSVAKETKSKTIKAKALKLKDMEAKSAKTGEVSKTELRTLNLIDAEDLDFVGSADELDGDAASFTANESVDITDVLKELPPTEKESTFKHSMGVKSMIKQAKKNLEKIDLPEVEPIRSFKDVILTSKKLEQAKSFKK